MSNDFFTPLFIQPGLRLLRTNPSRWCFCFSSTWRRASKPHTVSSLTSLTAWLFCWFFRYFLLEGFIESSLPWMKCSIFANLSLAHFLLSYSPMAWLASFYLHSSVANSDLQILGLRLLHLLSSMPSFRLPHCSSLSHLLHASSSRFVPYLSLPHATGKARGLNRVDRHREKVARQTTAIALR